MTVSKIRKQIPVRIRAVLQKEIDSECPFCRNEDVGHFEVHHIDESPSNNDVANLLMICRICHSKITKGDISTGDVEKKKKELISTVGTLKRNSRKRIAKSIFSSKEELEFEYIRHELDKAIEITASQKAANEDQPKAKKENGWWIFQISVLDLLLQCFRIDSQSFVGFYELTPRSFVIEHEGNETYLYSDDDRYRFHPDSILIKLGLLTSAKGHNLYPRYTSKMQRFVLWIEYNNISPNEPTYRFKPRQNNS